MSALDIYDFEGAVEPAIATVFKANDLKAFTTRDPLTYQKIRPRLEIMYLHGAGEGRLQVVGAQVGEPSTYDYRRESAWRGQLKLDVISEAVVSQHAVYVALSRALMANIWTQLNGSLLTFHKLHFARDGGSSPRWKTADGFFATTLLYDTSLSMQANAWQRLNDPQPLSLAT